MRDSSDDLPARSDGHVRLEILTVESPTGSPKGSQGKSGFTSRNQSTASLTTHAGVTRERVGLSWNNPSGTSSVSLLGVSHDGSKVRAPTPRDIPSEIIPGFLFLGSQRAANSKDRMAEYGITRYLCCAAEAPLPSHVEPERLQSGDVEIKHIPMRDGAKTQLQEHFNEAFTFIRAAKRARRRVLVYCREGKSRSASIIIAYFIRYMGMSYEEALAAVRTKRSVVDPNFAFCNQLGEFGAEERRRTTPPPLTPIDPQGIDDSSAGLTGFKCVTSNQPTPKAGARANLLSLDTENSLTLPHVASMGGMTPSAPELDLPAFDLPGSSPRRQSLEGSASPASARVTRKPSALHMTRSSRALRQALMADEDHLEMLLSSSQYLHSLSPHPSFLQSASSQQLSLPSHLLQRGDTPEVRSGGGTPEMVCLPSGARTPVYINLGATTQLAQTLGGSTNSESSQPTDALGETQISGMVSGGATMPYLEIYDEDENGIEVEDDNMVPQRLVEDLAWSASVPMEQEREGAPSKPQLTSVLGAPSPRTMLLEQQSV